MKFQIWGLQEAAVIYEDAVCEWRITNINAYLRVNWDWRFPARFYSLN